MYKRKNNVAKIYENKSEDETSNNSSDGAFVRTFILTTCVKLLLFPTYRSTDFEVHRNWLAITHSLPVNEWYTNDKSQWTLDYPPFFAWFEYCLSQFAQFFDAKMLQVDNLEYQSFATVAFQRSTVVFMDLLFAFGAREISKKFCKSVEQQVTLTFLLLCNVGLLLVDHIHFQYNGFLLGVLLLSMTLVSSAKNAKILLGALSFAVLLNLKHIYLYIAPAFIVWLLKWCCSSKSVFLPRIAQLASIALVVAVVSLAPFATQIPQVLSRLFPFKRGLLHAFWAANAWALYAGLDKFLIIVWRFLKWPIKSRVATMTGGLVQEGTFAILPTPTPIITIVLSFATMIPALYALFFSRRDSTDSKRFVKCLVLCALCSFMFSWHVHEKAILTAIVPLSVLAVLEKSDARVYLVLSSAGHAALLPLLFSTELIPLKVLVIFISILINSLLFSRRYSFAVLNSIEWLYVIFIPFLTIYESILHKTIFGERYQFLPLAVTSIYCSVGVVYAWIVCYLQFIRNTEIVSGKQIKMD